MIDQSTIATKLTALAAQDDVFKDGQRVISKGLPPLVAILREIDDTVLERTLIFNIDAVSVSAVVAGRRLRGIVEISGDIPGKDDVVGQVMSHEEPETMKAAGILLNQLCTADAQVTVQSAAVRPIGSSSEAGVSITALATEWGVDLDAKPPSAMSRFLQSNAAYISDSMVVVDVQPAETTGDATALQAIWDAQVTQFRKKHMAVLGKQDSPMLICLEGAMEGKPLGFAIAGPELCLFSYHANDLPSLLASWNAINLG